MDKNSEVTFPDTDKEYLFPDVIDKICEYLNITDLLSVSKVCTLWESAAFHEMFHKRPSEMLILPCTSSELMELNNVRFHAFDIVRAKPFLALLFFNNFQYSMSSDNYLKKVIQAYKGQLKCEIIAARVAKSFLNDRSNNTISEEIIPLKALTIPFPIPSIFLTRYKQTEIKFSYCIEEPDISAECAATIMYNDLMDNISDPWLTIIVFATQPGFQIVQSFLNLIAERHDSLAESASIWGCKCNDLITVLNDSADTHNRLICTGIRIYGSNVKSWTFLIHDIEKQQYEEQIDTFKKGIELKTHTIGIIASLESAPRLDSSFIINVLVNDIFDVYDNSDRVAYLQIFKTAFPTVDFVNITTTSYLFGHNTINICKYDKDVEVIGAIMLITYT